MDTKRIDSPPESDSLPETDSSTQSLTSHGISAMQGNDSRSKPEEPSDASDWKDLGIINVPVKDLPAPEDVNSPQDFNHHISWEDAKSASLQLPQIQQDVAAGKTGDDFSTEDQAAGVDWQHGRRRVYDLYYSAYDPVQVDKIGDDYVINSGRHRIFAAKALGLETIPARVKEKQG